MKVFLGGIVLIGLFLLVVIGFVAHPDSPTGFAVQSNFAEPIFSMRNNVVSITDDAVYKIGYYSVAGGPWQSFTLAGTTLADSWLTFGSAKFPSFGEGTHHIIIYSCSNNDGWDCYGNRWQLYTFQNSGLVAHWDFENGLTNNINSYDGTAHGDVSIISHPHKGKVLSVGSTGSVRISDDKKLDLSRTISLSAWFTLDDLTHSKILVKPFPGGDDPWEIYALDVRDGNVRFILSDGTSYNLGGWHVLTSKVNLHEWYHVVGTYDGTNMKLYVNNVLVNTLAVDISLYNSPEDLYIGKYLSGNSFSGLIDDVMIYDYALATNKIRELFETQKPAVVNEVIVTPAPTDSSTTISTFKFDTPTTLSIHPTLKYFSNDFSDEYIHHYAKNNIDLTTFSNIETTGFHISKSHINVDQISGRIRERGSADWRQLPPFYLVENSKYNLATTSVFDLKSNTIYECEMRVGSTKFPIQFKTQSSQLSFLPKKTLWVDARATTSGVGSSQLPYNRIQKALDVAKPGDKIRVASGTYYEHLIIKQSGTVNNWIQLIADGDVIIRGDIPSYHLENEAGWKRWTTYPNCNYPIEQNKLWKLDLTGNSVLKVANFYALFRDGKSFFNYETHQSKELASRESLQNIAIGMRCRDNSCQPIDEGFYFESSSNTLYMRSLDHPSNHEFNVPITDPLIRFNGHDWMWIEGFEFRNGQGHSWNEAGGILMDGSVSHSIIRNNKFVNAGGSAIRLYTKYVGNNILTTGGAFNRIENNYITYPGTGSLHYVLTKNNRMRGGAIILEGAMMNIVRKNTIYDSFLGISGYSMPFLNAGFVVNHQYEADIYDNTINKISSARLAIQNQWVNTRVFRNTMKDGHVGFALLDYVVGPVWYVRNIIHNSAGEVFKVRPVSPSPTTLFYHNTILKTDLLFPYFCSAQEKGITPAMICADRNYDWTPYWKPENPTADCIYAHFLWAPSAIFKSSYESYHFRNNIFLSTNYMTLSIPSTSSNKLVDLDYNSYWRAGTSRYFTGIATIHGDIYDSISSIYTPHGIEQHGIKAEPRFTSSSSYQLISSSPLIDRGVLLSGINDNYAGSAPDIGAVESK